ncbi:MAG: tRNA preQ1(34) S-adenosylmethionine ribosyltransferase-isomerase QueA [Patescibacteria group bacterium]|mgnify:CR=1 FL=1
MKLSDFDYNLPEELIASHPVVPRDHSRLLILHRDSGRIEHRHFYDLSRYLRAGDVLVCNDTKVFPARLIGRRAETGGRVEVLLERELSPDQWRVVGRGLKVGQRIVFAGSNLKAIITGKEDETYLASFNYAGEDFFTELERIGQVPLPPYIIRRRTDRIGERINEYGNDRKNYQTVYARHRGSAAAPTAGLHFTPELIDRIKQMGIKVLNLTLHVGLGTFAPVKSENVEDHKMHSEYFSIGREIIEKIILAKREHRRIIAIGTTTTRVLEHVFSDPMICDTKYVLRDLSGWTDIFIHPPYQFKCIDGLITNFHLPRSTLLLLVSAFAGPAWIKKAYAEAVNRRYRFYSYGDAMLII